MVSPRSAVREMRPYSPPTGGRLGKERLDFNENVVGCSPAVSEVLARALTGDLLATYPDYESVKADLAAFFGVGADEMLLTNGTDEAIQVLVNTFVEPGDEVVILTPSYAMYRFYAEVAGASIVEAPYRSGSLEFDKEAVLASISPMTRAILISNPNNPTGSVVQQADLAEILRAAPQACVLVDEAYFEFYGQTVLPWIGDYRNLFVSRTFSKAYGLAALRVGCLFSNRENAGWMRRAQSPYSVNMFAALAAQAAIKNEAYVCRYVAETLQGRSAIAAAFQRLGIPFWPSEANFILFDAGDRADVCLDRCRAAGVLIRDRRHEIAGALRVTAGPLSQVARFVSILEEVWS